MSLCGVSKEKTDFFLEHVSWDPQEEKYCHRMKIEEILSKSGCTVHHLSLNIIGFMYCKSLSTHGPA